MAWIIDTNVLSELRKPRPNHAVVSFVSKLPLDETYVSVVTLAEIRFGIVRVDDPILQSDFSVWLAKIVRPMFEGGCFPSLRKSCSDGVFSWSKGAKGQKQDKPG